MYYITSQKIAYLHDTEADGMTDENADAVFDTLEDAKAYVTKHYDDCFWKTSYCQSPVNK